MVAAARKGREQLGCFGWLPFLLRLLMFAAGPVPGGERGVGGHAWGAAGEVPPVRRGLRAENKQPTRRVQKTIITVIICPMLADAVLLLQLSGGRLSVHDNNTIHSPLLRTLSSSIVSKNAPLGERRVVGS
jgi:hypothetical protein